MYDTLSELFVSAFLFTYALAFLGLIYWTIRTWLESQATQLFPQEQVKAAESQTMRAMFNISITNTGPLIQ